jgi:hypothetical protein
MDLEFPGYRPGGEKRSTRDKPSSSAFPVHLSENKASTISTHLSPGMTLRFIWFIT